MNDEMVVDSFAGGGGASLGISWALGHGPDVAINHDAAAITMHATNHPATKHFTEDVWKVDPRSVTGGRPVGLLWASPDCKHFSRAKGGKPVEKKIRSLAWVVVKWAAEVKPRIIILENVREFEDWGPLVPSWQCQDCTWKGTEGQAKLARRGRACPHCESKHLKETENLMPDPERKGLTFRRWVGRLRAAGYKTEWKTLNAADYGAPTHRRRLFLIARLDGCAIVWPEPTHGDPKKIVGDLFSGNMKPWRTAAECINWSLPCPSIFDRKKPLAEKTMRRIALGIKRYVLESPRPFIVGNGGLAYAGEPRDSERPMGTVMPKNSSAVVTPFFMPVNHGGNHQRGHAPDEPMHTITASKGEAVIVPTLIQMGYGEREGQSPRVLDLDKPMGTVVAGGNKQALVSAFLAKHYGGVVGVPIDTPLPTTTERGTQNQVVAANLIRFNHDDAGVPIEAPMATVLTNNHAALVYSFLVKYFGTAIGQMVDDPLHTVTSKDRFGLIIVYVKGEPYVIVDIGMRMLTPRELARGQGFPDSYILTGNNTNQVARIGNSVSPVIPNVLVKANYWSKPTSKHFEAAAA